MVPGSVRRDGGGGCALLAAASLPRPGEPAALLRLVGAALYVFGTLGVTRAFNVPRNDALAAVDAEGADGAATWARYVPEWTAWNTVRTVAALAAGAFTLALVAGSGGLGDRA